MASVSEGEVLLLWRAVYRLRSGRRPLCRPRGAGQESICPLLRVCPRWDAPDEDYLLALEETTEQTEERRAAWPCSALLDRLGPQVSQIG